MQMFRFWKVGQKKGFWKSYLLEAEQAVLDNEASAFTTVLAVDFNPGKDEAIPETASYAGPFYIDIDSESIKKAINAATKVYNRLLKNGVAPEFISMYATGKRGFHFVIPQACFTKDGPMPKLPKIYWHMAASLKLPEETDMTVYSSGRGRMWRLPNKKREDNGKFKVQITPTELVKMTLKEYADLTSAPRDTWAPKPKLVPFLKALYDLAKGRAERSEKPKAIFVDPEMRALLGDSLPPCASMMLASTDIRQGQGFNALSIQFAKAVVAFAPQDARELINEFAENSKGDNYNTLKKRADHCFTAVKIASKNSDYQWSCSSALSVLGSEPCMDCPIAHIRLQQDGATQEGRAAPQPVEAAKPLSAPKGRGLVQASTEAMPALAAEFIEPSEDIATEYGKAVLQAQALQSRTGALEEEFEGDGEPEPEPQAEFEADDGSVQSFGPDEGLMTTDEGYGFMTAEGHMRRVSNFTLNLLSHYVQWIEPLKADRRVAVLAEIIVNKVVVGVSIMEEGNWSSKGSLIACLGGIANVAFYGKDDDVQRMKSSLMADLENKTNKIRRVNTCGMHRSEVDGEFVFTYVEPGWSTDKYGNENLFYLVGTPNGFPRLKNVRLPQSDEDKRELTKALISLMRMNRPETMAQTIGWYCAAFLKQHITVFRNEFPLLSVYGNRGSGKSTTTSLLAALHGINYVLEHSPVSMPSSSPFAVWSTLSTSMSVPRIMEEYNKSKCKRYEEFGEYFKDCWNSYAVTRGQLNHTKGAGSNPMGVDTVQYPLTAPVVICSEQGIMMPALVQRTVQVGMSERDLDSVPEAREHYTYARRNHQRFWQFGKAAYLYALELSPDDVNAWLQQYVDVVPIQIGDRPHYSFTVVLMGLDFMRYVCEQIGLDCLEDIDKLKEVLIAEVNSDILAISTSKRRTEIDIIMIKLATMAAVSQKEGASSWMMPGQHYFRTGSHLYLDGMVCHSVYVRYMNQVERTPPSIEDYAQMKPLLKSESYFLSTNAFVEGFCNGRPVVKLDTKKMAEKGIEIEAFLLTGEDE